MVWTLTDLTFEWPSELKSSTYKKADKHALVENVLASLDDAEKHIRTVKVPQEQSSNNPLMLEHWEQEIAAFISGPAKKIGGNLAVIKTRAANALKDKDISKSKEMSAALTGITNAVTDYAQRVQATVLQSQAAKIQAAAEKRILATLTKGLGPNITNWKAVTAKSHPAITLAKKLLENLETSKDRAKDIATINDSIHNGARNMTTQSVTLIKAFKRGLEAPGLAASDYKAIEAMNKWLIPYANAGGDWTQGGNMKIMQMGVRNVSAQRLLFDQISKKFTL